MSFFATVALSWWTVVNGRYGKAGYGLGFLFVFATAVRTTVLGALVATAPRAPLSDLQAPSSRIRAPSGL